MELISWSVVPISKLFKEFRSSKFLEPVKSEETVRELSILRPVVLMMVFAVQLNTKLAPKPNDDLSEEEDGNKFKVEHQLCASKPQAAATHTGHSTLLEQTKILSL